MFLMQDSVSEVTKPLLGVEINKPIKTVYSVLASARALALLEDPALATATEEILVDKNKTRGTIQLEIKRKEKAIDMIIKKYHSTLLSTDDIRLCLYSISDNNSFLNSNRKPITDCIDLLKEYFHPNSNLDPRYSLSIDEGEEILNCLCVFDGFLLLL